MNPQPGQQNQQHNQAANGGTVIANQGNGSQKVRITQQALARRSRAGWAVLVILFIDAAFFLYGSLSYTGQTGNSGDLWRAGIFLFLFATTGSLIRRWLRVR